MMLPVFEEYEPTADCGCEGCAHQRRALRHGDHPSAHGARRALVLVTAAGVALGGSGAAEAAARTFRPAALSADQPAGQAAAPRAAGRLPATNRTDIISRAQRWVGSQVPYSMDKYWSDGYRQDCSGFVSMAWNLDGSEWTGSLAEYGSRIAADDLQPGDILLFHNPANPTKGSHVTIFGGWADDTHTSYVAYEETPPHARRQVTPYAYWSNSSRYVAYRYKGLIGGSPGGGPGTSTRFPGTKYFGPGTRNAYVTQLGKMLVKRGASRYYQQGPGPSWGNADRLATQAFQRAQGWKGSAADGLPGPSTWGLLVGGGGKSIPKAGQGGSGGSPATAAFPGKGSFRPGQSSASVEKLGRQLVKKGFGTYYTSGPGPRWTEADRRNVEAFQRAQGWRGGAADGYPGPETWRRLFA
ncbi:peptidoglycan-binding protein [Streptomyces beijiangensis]|uniref:Peptidoglycan-binding protein n=1 Tax=Streptomyces beijiangensis TaxID=163361 RepID=A0A939JIH6_9ACTN|nr:peptidoglycan-binding protein [Streptomyces beijiangensis]MBO0515523.1 peptidoglycan-binding protein [Streptomyces beijiangensis]